ncbi:MAG: flagellin, partial [Proteobacteria bacterium]|nr:flagellin [Pseudomonadota bacterium]
MPLSIATNMASMTAQRSFLNSNAALETAFERLSTGKRVNSSVDDAAGLAIGKELESRVSGLNQAIRNVNDGISMVQIAEGTLDEVTTILQRMRDLAVQASNDSLSSDERGYLDNEHSSLASALDAALGQAKFNGVDLVDTDGTSMVIQSGADSSDETTISIGGLTDSVLRVAPADVTLNAARAERTVFDDFAYGSEGLYTVTLTAVSGSDTTITATTLAGDTISDLAGDLTTAATGITFSVSDGQLIATWDSTGTQAASYSGYTITSSGLGATNDTAAVVYRGTANAQESAQLAISEIDTALSTVASNRASLGATQAQLESTVRNLANVAENTAAAAGRIMDTDYAAETANLTKAQILQQAATSILAQANAQPQAV